MHSVAPTTPLQSVEVPRSVGDVTAVHVAIIGLCALLLVAVAVTLYYRRKRRQEDEVNLSELLDEETLEAGQMEGQILDEIAERHKSVVAPAAVEWETRAARVGEQWTSTLYIADYPDYPKDGYLNELFELTDIEFDLTAHITPKNQQQARDELQRVADDLQVDADLEVHQLNYLILKWHGQLNQPRFFLERLTYAMHR